MRKPKQDCDADRELGGCVVRRGALKYKLRVTRPLDSVQPLFWVKYGPGQSTRGGY
jgi:hypothetical protein